MPPERCDLHHSRSAPLSSDWLRDMHGSFPQALELLQKDRLSMEQQIQQLEAEGECKGFLQAIVIPLT